MNLFLILIMLTKLATLDLLKMKLFLNKIYDVLILSMTSTTDLYNGTQIVLQMWSSEQSLVILVYL